MINVSSWYKRKWKAVTKLDAEDHHWGKEVWIPLIISLIILIAEICFFCIGC